MRATHTKTICLAVLAAVMILAPVSMVFGKDVPLMTKEELRSIMSDADVAVIDVRTGRAWASSEFKIKGAEYGDPKNIAAWYEKYAKTTMLILYCD